MQDDVIPGHRQYLPRVSRQEEEEDESHCSKRGQATAGSLSFIPQYKTITKAHGNGQTKNYILQI